MEQAIQKSSVAFWENGCAHRATANFYLVLERLINLAVGSQP